MMQDRVLRDVFTALVVLKGCIEDDRNRAGAYFGSWLGLNHHIRSALRLGLIEGDIEHVETLRPTLRGSSVYTALQLDSLPHRGRGYMWDWTQVEESAAWRRIRESLDDQDCTPYRIVRDRRRYYVRKRGSTENLRYFLKRRNAERYIEIELKGRIVEGS